MNQEELTKKNGRAQNLVVFQVEDDLHYVESSRGQICYKIVGKNGNRSCTCPDYQNNIKQDKGYVCKHILALINGNGNVRHANFNGNGKLKLDERFVMTLDKKDFVKYPGLLDLAHQKGVAGVVVNILQFPSKENDNTAICQATVKTPDGNVFVDIGDGSPQSCTAMSRKHYVRIASTRAMARAFRTYTNIGMTCLEELSDINDALGDTPKETKKSTPAKKEVKKFDKPEKFQKSETKTDEPEDFDKPDASTKSAGGNNKPDEKPGNNGNKKPAGDLTKISEAQMKAIRSLAEKRNIDSDQLESKSEEMFGLTIDALSSKDASAFIRDLQAA